MPDNIESGVMLPSNAPKLFYHPNKVLSLLDIDGMPPELYFVYGNKTAGKTFSFKSWIVRRFLRFKEKFVVFVRNIDDIPNTAEGFWVDIGPICFKGKTMTQKSLINGKAARLFIDGKNCGYVVPLSSAALEKIKRNSAVFSDAVRGFFDEFMTESGVYLPNEVRNFNSVRTAIARGGAKGEYARRFPVYFCANNVSIFNPYFSAFGIDIRITSRAKFLRGRGWVVEQVYNPEAAHALRKNFRTMSAEELAYATENKPLLDTNAFVKAMPGNKYIIACIRNNNKTFGIWQCNDGKIFISRKYDPSCRYILATNNGDHQEGTWLVGSTNRIIKRLREAYERGWVYFDSGASRNNFIIALRIV